MPRVSPQLIVFSYHKTGTSLLLHVMTKVCERLGLTLVNHFGLVDRLDAEPDVVLLPHSLLRAPLDRPYRAIRMIRDPRDIWVSGYLYHRHCTEEWCINTNLDPTMPIGWPRVDHSFVHWPEDWKRRYLERLDGRSYQRNLLDRSAADGLAFELEGYTGCTLAAMRGWTLNGAEAMDVRLEDVMADFDGVMTRIFDHFGFTPEQSAAALDIARSEDVRRMDDATIATRPQIHSRTVSKWRAMLSAEQVAAFEAEYGDLIRELGYEPSGLGQNRAGAREVPEGRLPEARVAQETQNLAEARISADVEDVAATWTVAEAPGLPVPPDFAEFHTVSASANVPASQHAPEMRGIPDVQKLPASVEVDKWFADIGASLAADPREVDLVWPGVARSVGESATGGPMTGDADVRLLADGVAIRPTVRGATAYRFVVPPGAKRLWLVSRRGVPADPRAPYLGEGRCLGVRVSEIAIESRADEVVIPADDPRLVAGWHAAEQSGPGFWRWTDGAAELPWSDVSGPAVVTVHCTTLAEYPVEQGTVGRDVVSVHHEASGPLNAAS